MIAGANLVELDAVLEGREMLRYSPAGIPILGATLSHGSSQTEAGAKREVSIEIAAAVAGRIAESADRLGLGSKLLVRCFLARTRRDSRVLVLHVTEF